MLYIHHSVAFLAWWDNLLRRCSTGSLASLMTGLLNLAYSINSLSLKGPLGKWLGIAQTNGQNQFPQSAFNRLFVST